MAVQTQIQTRRGTAASWTSTNPTLAAGEIGFESDTGKIKIGTGSTAWNALAYTASSTAVTYLFNATAAQTTFSGTDANGLTLAYTVGSEQVYLNGVLQVRGSDYTATNGTSIVLTSGALVSDVLNVIAFSALALSDTYTQAQADAKFFQNANAFVAAKNKIINGNFGVNQRSFSTNTTTGIYMYDRWICQISGDGTSTFTAQTFTPGTAPVSGYEGSNYLRVVTAGQTTTAVATNTAQRVESVRTLAGQTVTLSFWAKAATGTPKIALDYRQNFGTGGSPSATVTTVASQVVISTSWARYSITTAIPSISGKTLGTTTDGFIAPVIWFSAGSDNNANTGSMGIQNNTFEIWGIQLEAGSIATAFQTATGTIQGELAACQRYYYRNTATGDADTAFNYGVATSTARTDHFFQFPVTMRTRPTSAGGSDLKVIDLTGNNFAITSLTLNAYNAQGGFLYSGGATGMTQFRAMALLANTTSSYVEFSAEI
jgi:hypothetical protein